MTIYPTVTVTRPPVGASGYLLWTEIDVHDTSFLLTYNLIISARSFYTIIVYSVA
jgi:hypothetical protein